MTSLVDDVEMGEQPAPLARSGLTPDASRLFRVYKTVASMLNKRGYMVPRDMREMTPTSFAAKFGESPSRESLTILVEKADDETNQLFVFFPEDEKVGVKPIKVYTDRMREENVTNAILVLKVDITPFARQAVQEMGDSFRIEHFKEAELLVDITEHTLVPEHQVLTPNEKQELLKRYRLKETQLPRIQLNDPVARYFGLRRGQVVKIIRPSETADLTGTGTSAGRYRSLFPIPIPLEQQTLWKSKSQHTSPDDGQSSLVWQL